MLSEQVDLVAGKIVRMAQNASRTWQRGDVEQMIADLAAGKTGWFHDTVLCHLSPEEIAEHGRQAARNAAETLGIRLPEECYW